MKTLFIASDIHSYFDEWMKALKRKKFDINNPDHILVVCGDIFDRGPKSLEVYRFIKSLPKERRILIRGNHEILLRELCARKYAENYDYHNGTVNTVWQLNEWDDDKETHDYYKKMMELREHATPEQVRIFEHEHGLWNRRNKLYSTPIMKEVLDWIASDEWKNYWEIDDYIFVHGFIPLRQHINWAKSQWAGVLIKDGPDTFREDWRNAFPLEWEDATWFNWNSNYQSVRNGLNQTGKYIVVGHWNTSDLYILLNGTKKSTYDCPIYISKRYKIVGMDACTAGSGRVNVMKLEITNEEWEKWK